jgi:hypothetical protein
MIRKSTALLKSMRESSKNKRPDAELSTSREFRPLNLGQNYVGLGSHFEHRASHSDLSPRTRIAPTLVEMTVAEWGQISVTH